MEARGFLLAFKSIREHDLLGKYYVKSNIFFQVYTNATEDFQAKGTLQSRLACKIRYNAMEFHQRPEH